MTIHAIYVPGSAALPHNTYDIVGYRTGAFSQYEITNAGIYYFHFAIPTPVLIGNGRAELLDVAVFYDTGGSDLTDVSVYDGDVKVQMTPVQSRAGNNVVSGNFVLTPPPPAKFAGFHPGETLFVGPTNPRRHAVVWGVDIVLTFQGALPGPQLVKFYTAGVRFEIP